MTRVLRRLCMHRLTGSLQSSRAESIGKRWAGKGVAASAVMRRKGETGEDGGRHAALSLSLMAGNGCSEYRCLRIKECPSDSHIHNVSLRQANGAAGFTYSCIIQPDCGPCSLLLQIRPATASPPPLIVYKEGAAEHISLSAQAFRIPTPDPAVGRPNRRGDGEEEQRKQYTLLHPFCTLSPAAVASKKGARTSSPEPFNYG